MVVYLDLLFLENFLINGVFLYLIEKIYKTKLKLIRIILGGIIGGVIVIISLFYHEAYFFFKILGGVIIGLVGLEKLESIKNVVKISSFYTLNLASIGLVSSFGIINHWLIYFSIGLILVIYIIESNKNIFIFSNQLKYNITVNFNKTSLNLIGYLDTGNFSSCDNIPIIYIHEKYYPKELIYYDSKLVKIATVNNVNYLKAYEPKKCTIKIGRKSKECKVLVIFCKLQNVDCLMNVKMFI